MTRNIYKVSSIAQTLRLEDTEEMTLEAIRKMYLGKRCGIYEYGRFNPETGKKETIWGTCIDITELDWSFDTGTSQPLTIPRGKYDVRIAKDKKQGEDYARLEDSTRQP